MSEHSRQEVARRAGVDPDYVDHIVELGILKPGEGDVFSAGDVRKARWIQSLERAGVPLDEMAAAVQRGALSFSFLEMSAFDRFAGLAGVTFQEVSESTGVPFELLMVVREAFGLSEPMPDDYVREGELSLIATVEHQVRQGFRLVVIERWLRVYADSLRRIAETEADWYRTEVVEPFFEAGLTEAEMLEAQGEFGSEMAPLTEKALLAIYRGQQEYVWTKTAVDSVEGALETAGLYERLHRPPAVSFLDLSGFTRLTEEGGDEVAADLAARLRALVRRSSQEHGGESVKWLGDGVMLYFPDPASGVLASLDMVERAAHDALPPARVGMHAGPVIFQEGDYFGRTVNIASRIADQAGPGEVLVTQEVVEASSASPLSFTEIGPVTLKGVRGPPTSHRSSTRLKGRPRSLADMSYGWWKFIHLAGVVGFVAAHGTSMAATVLMRRIREPQQVAGVLQLSAATVSAFYVSTLVLLLGGIGAGMVGQWFDQGWIWLSLGLLVGVGVLMFPMARRHFRRIRMILELMETGTAVSQDDFARVVNSGNPVLTAGTGFVAILFIVYLMVLKPF